MITDPDGSGKQIANYQMVAIATSRDRTLQAGKLFLIDLNGSEAHSTAIDLTPLDPGRPRRPARRASAATTTPSRWATRPPGRFLVSWADGPVESETLALAQHATRSSASTCSTATRRRASRSTTTRRCGTCWPRPLQRAPRAVADAGDAGVAAQHGGHDDRRAQRLRLVAGDIKANLTPGSVVKVRLLEGFSGEEGGVDMFGTTEFDGQSRYGEVPVQADGSFAAEVPANVPVPHPADRQVRA